MGTLLCFPETSSRGNASHFRDLSQAIPDLICRLESLQNFAEDSVSEALSRLEIALENIDAIGRLLPPGEFKAQFDLDRSVLATRLNLAKDGLIDLWSRPIG